MNIKCKRKQHHSLGLGLLHQLILGPFHLKISQQSWTFLTQDGDLWLKARQSRIYLHQLFTCETLLLCRAGQLSLSLGYKHIATCTTSRPTQPPSLSGTEICDSRLDSPSTFHSWNALSPSRRPTVSEPRLHTMQNMTNDQPPRPSQPPILSRTEICDTRLNSRAFTSISFSLAKWWQPFNWISCLFYLQADSTESHHPLYVDCLMSVPTIQIWTDNENKTIPQG